MRVATNLPPIVRNSRALRAHSSKFEARPSSLTSKKMEDDYYFSSHDREVLEELKYQEDEYRKWADRVEKDIKREQAQMQRRKRRIRPKASTKKQ